MKISVILFAEWKGECRGMGISADVIPFNILGAPAETPLRTV
jgi:hypothetical protein